MKRRREQQPAPSPPRGKQKTAATSKSSTKDAAADTAADTPKPSRKKGKKQKQKQQDQQGAQVRRWSQQYIIDTYKGEGGVNLADVQFSCIFSI